MEGTETLISSPRFALDREIPRPVAQVEQIPQPIEIDIHAVPCGKAIAGSKIVMPIDAN
jgi:hypothetical protein